MCGIFGVWNLEGNRIDPLQVRRATTLLRHRGPDDEGYLFIDTARDCRLHCGGADTVAALDLPRIDNLAEKSFNFAFGFRRLSILDLSPSGHQPMAGADGRQWIIFNGEIYNYLELRAELAALGHEFHTGSDTEVILAAYQQWGHDCLSRFNGMWALALWDATKRELFCGRDRLGVKPFYFYFDGRRFIFGSEIKAMLEMAPELRQVNHPYLAHFLMTGALDYADQTFFENIQALRPAHFLTIKADGNAITPRRYWDVNPEAINSAYDYSHPENTFLELLQDSVRLRLRSDVPVGTCLSGGLDSSSIVAMSSKLLPHAINSFSSIYSHPGYSEERFIKLVSETFKTNAHFTSPDPQKFFELLHKIVWHMDEPAAGPGVYSQWFVMELASQTVTVLLDGQGGDELFAGYSPYLPLHLLSLARKAVRAPALLPRLLQDAFAIMRDGRRNFFPELSARQFAQRVIARLSGRRYRADLYLHPEMAEAQRRLALENHNPIAADDAVNRKLYNDVTRDSIPALLHYEDRSSMAFSIEARVPLLDYRMVEFAMGLPGEKKIKGSTTKYFVRQALKSVLPEAVRARRDKMGYPTPLALWLRESLRAQTEEILQEHFRKRNFYNLSTVQRMWREHQAGTAEHSWHIFRWLTTEFWMRNFIDG